MGAASTFTIKSGGMLSSRLIKGTIVIVSQTF